MLNLPTQCLVSVYEGRNIADLFVTVRGLIEDMVRGSLSEGLAIVEQLLSHCDKFPKYSKEFGTRLEHVCGARMYFSDTLRKKAEKDKEQIMRARKILFHGELLINRLFSNLFELRQVDSLMTESMSQFLVNNITKHELAKQFSSKENVTKSTKREPFLQKVIDSQDLMKQFQNQLIDIFGLLYEGYGNLRVERPITINDSSVHCLELVKKAVSLDKLSDSARTGDARGIVREMKSVLLASFERTSLDVLDPVLVIRDILKMVETNLREYQDSIKIDSQFYL